MIKAWKEEALISQVIVLMQLQLNPYFLKKKIYINKIVV